MQGCNDPLITFGKIVLSCQMNNSEPEMSPRSHLASLVIQFAACLLSRFVTFVYCCVSVSVSELIDDLSVQSGIQVSWPVLPKGLLNVGINFICSGPVGINNCASFNLGIKILKLYQLRGKTVDQWM